MTEPVIKISGLPGVDRNTTGGGVFKRGKGERHPRSEEDDSVDISDEARSRAADGKRGADRDHGDKAK
jgi:hypothetical protein